MKPFSESIIYDIYNDRDDEIILDLNVDHGQLSQTLIKLEGEVLGEKSNSFTLKLGRSRDLVKKYLYLFIVVSDINPENDNVGIDLKLTGGKKLTEYKIVDTKIENMTSHSGIVQIYLY